MVIFVIVEAEGSMNIFKDYEGNKINKVELKNKYPVKILLHRASTLTRCWPLDECTQTLGMTAVVYFTFQEKASS